MASWACLTWVSISFSSHTESISLWASPRNNSAVRLRDVSRTSSSSGVGNLASFEVEENALPAGCFLLSILAPHPDLCGPVGEAQVQRLSTVAEDADVEPVAM